MNKIKIIFPRKKSQEIKPYCSGFFQSDNRFFQDIFFLLNPGNLNNPSLITITRTIISSQ